MWCRIRHHTVFLLLRQRLVFTVGFKDLGSKISSSRIILCLAEFQHAAHIQIQKRDARSNQYRYQQSGMHGEVDLRTVSRGFRESPTERWPPRLGGESQRKSKKHRINWRTKWLKCFIRFRFRVVILLRFSIFSEFPSLDKNKCKILPDCCVCRKKSPSDEFFDWGGASECKSEKSRQQLRNEYIVAKIQPDRA